MILQHHILITENMLQQNWKHMDIQGKAVWVAKIIILFCLIPNVNASTYPNLQVLW